eukprot:1196336-Prorocentrum_minimum.AAC.3
MKSVTAESSSVLDMLGGRRLSSYRRQTPSGSSCLLEAISTSSAGELASSRVQPPSVSLMVSSPSDPKMSLRILRCFGTLPGRVPRRTQPERFHKPGNGLR